MTALLALAVGTLPGFPLATFVVIAGVLALVVFLRWRQQRVDSGDSRPGEPQAPVEAEQVGELGLQGSLDDIATETVALMLLVPSSRLEALLDAKLAERFRNQFFVDYGLKIPLPQLRASEALPEHQVAVLINEVRADQFDIHFEHWRVLDYSPELAAMGCRWCVGATATTWKASGSQPRARAPRRSWVINCGRPMTSATAAW